jgi:uncharacterized damage-inducible protein DinB
MHHRDLIERYLRGTELLSAAVAGMDDEQLDAQPIAGKWSTRQVICHVVDFEPIYADRMKRVIAENGPTFFGGDPDVFAARLAYQQRAVAGELQLLAAIRSHMAAILRELTAADFERVGNHSEAGTMTLRALLTNITDHVPHHIRFIMDKRQSLGI